MREIHEKVCRTHIGSQVLANKIARAGYYYPTLKKDCTGFVKRLPSVMVSNNDIQFTSQLVLEFYAQLGVKQKFTFIKHPQSNKQAESANKIILQGLRRRLEEAKDRWTEELPQNEEEIMTNLDLLQDVKEIAHVKEVAAKARAAQ
ncbi:hypothetical protein CR513_26859, partial [Mucuna pruriens]